MPTADLVLEGGGVKGLGLTGAALRLMEAGYTFPRVAGTSAGSVLAALLAAGVTHDGLTEVMGRLDYRRVPDRAAPGIPFVSESLSLLAHRGAYAGDYVRDFMARELKALGVSTFGDLRRRDRSADANIQPYQAYKLVVTATDITHGRLLRLPWDYRLLGLDPDEQSVADAVRASISIPVFFEPVTLHDGRTGEPATLVDGGILSNFPIEIFDRTDAVTPRWPTLGVKVIPELGADGTQLLPRGPVPTPPVVELLERVVATAIIGHDQTYLARPCVRRRVMQVDTRDIGVLEFGAPKARRDAIIANGDHAARAFLETWDWEAFKRDCRAGAG